MVVTEAEAIADTPNHTGEAKWLTYGELASIRGIGRESAVKLVQREGWRRIRGNDGTARVLVPLDWLKTVHRKFPEHCPESSPEEHSVFSILAAQLAAKDAQIAALQAALVSTETRVDQLLTDLRAEREIVRAMGEQLARLAGGMLPLSFLNEPQGLSDDEAAELAAELAAHVEAEVAREAGRQPEITAALARVEAAEQERDEAARELAAVRAEQEAAQGREQAAQEAAATLRGELEGITSRRGWRGMLLRLAGAGARPAAHGVGQGS